MSRASSENSVSATERSSQLLDELRFELVIDIFVKESTKKNYDSGPRMVSEGGNLNAPSSDRLTFHSSAQSEGDCREGSTFSTGALRKPW